MRRDRLFASFENSVTACTNPVYAIWTYRPHSRLHTNAQNFHKNYSAIFRLKRPVQRTETGLKMRPFLPVTAADKLGC